MSEEDQNEALMFLERMGNLAEKYTIPSRMAHAFKEIISAERAKVSRLEAMRDQMMEGCDGHCALGECVCEKDQRVIDLKDEVADLEAQNAVMREALEAFIGKPPKRYSDKVIYSLPNPRAVLLGEKALSLTPSDAAEMMRRINTAIIRLIDSRTDTTGNSAKPKSLVETFWLDELEQAARAAGVEV